MVMIRNKAPGPRVFNTKTPTTNVVSQRVLAPGEAAELELLNDHEKDPHLQGWIKSGEIEILEGKDAKEVKSSGDLDLDALHAKRQEFAKLKAELDEMEALHQAHSMDQLRLTPPRQLGGDGGPEQMPTVDGQGGAKTGSQQEQGRQEPPPAEAEAKLAERRADAAKAAEEEKKAEASKPAHRGR